MISTDLYKGLLLLLSASDSEELDVDNEELAAFKLPLHSVVFKKLLEVITCAVA